jgi:hypothetical protein
MSEAVTKKYIRCAFRNAPNISTLKDIQGDYSRSSVCNYEILSAKCFLLLFSLALQPSAGYGLLVHEVS